MKFAVIGHPIKHSLSPVMHNANFKALNRDDEYVALDIAETHFHHIKDIIASKSIDGFNVTIPYKVAIMDYCDEVDDAAKMIGAVNTVNIKNGKWYGYNTDGIGYLSSIAPHITNRKNVLVIGAGGASRAICYTLKDSHDVTVVNRTLERTESWPFEVDTIKFQDLNKNYLLQFDLIINTTPVGMTGFSNSQLIDCSLLNKTCLVSDIIYTPEKTPLLMSAQSNNLTIVNGIGMFVMQGAKSFELWTNCSANIEAMSIAVKTALRGR